MTLLNRLPLTQDGDNVLARDARNGRTVVRDPLEAFLAGAGWFGHAWPVAPARNVRPTTGFAPRMDVIDAGPEFRVTLELPGVDEKAIELSIDGATLVVKGEKRAAPREEQESALHAERAYGAFQRALELPCEVDAGAVEAKLEHGLLTIRLPKSEKAKPRRVEVRSA